MKVIRVNLDRKICASHQIHVGDDILERMGLILARADWASRYFVVTDSNVGPIYAEEVLAVLREANLAADLLEFPAREGSKGLETCLRLVETMTTHGADRTSALLALGGGVVGDVTGFVASVYMRGIPYIQVPTTLLAQVDSGIGGKTGIDLPQGKNLLGTFLQPKAVFIDLRFLQTLSDRDFANGLAEVVKYGLIDDPELFAMVEAQAEAIMRRDLALLEELVSKSCTIKKSIVELDETERGLRRILNFGHTIGHAIEAESGYTISHGEAVSMGMVAEAVLSEKTRHLSRQERQRIECLLRSCGLPQRIPASLSTDRIISRIGVDKKRRGGVVPFVLLKKIGFPFVNGNIQEELLRETIEELKE